MKKLTDDYGNDLLDENGCIQFINDETYQCCSCENVFYAGLNGDYCPFCNSGNIVKGFIDEPQPKEHSLIRFNPLPPPSVSKHIELAPNRTDWLATYKNNTPPEGMKDYKIIVKGSVSTVKNWIKQRYSNCIDNNIRFELHKENNINIVFLPKFKKES